MIYEAQRRETISDSLKIGCVIAGMGQKSMREHLLMSATKYDSWTNFVREIESIEHARTTITAPTPMELDAFQGNCHKCGKYGHIGKECRSSSHGGAGKPQCAQCGKKHHGQCWVRSYTSSKKDSQKGGWKKVTEKETAREPRKMESSKEEKAETMGKEKVKERKDNVPTKSQNHQKNSGQVDLGNNGRNNRGTQKQTASWRDDGWHTADSNSQTSAAEEFQHASIGDLRLSKLGFVKHIKSFQDRLDPSQRTVTFCIDTAACKTVLPITLQHVDSWSTKTLFLHVRAALQAETHCMIKERGSCAP